MGISGHVSPLRTAARLFASLAIATLIASVGCASVTTPAEESSRRQAAIDRWLRCIEQQASAVPMTADAQANIEEGCEGHRRDVIHAFPPHMQRRLELMLDEREARLTRTTFVNRVGVATDGSVQGFAEPVSAD